MESKSCGASELHGHLGVGGAGAWCWIAVAIPVGLNCRGSDQTTTTPETQLSVLPSGTRRTATLGDGGCGGPACTRRHDDGENVAVGGHKRAARDRIGLAGI
jgi:hypothetical protein